MKIFAHRGASGEFPENTLIAFYKAIEQGATCFEFDVQATKDGIIVVSHDEEISRVSNGKGFIVEKTYAELEKYNFGNARYNQTLPTLLEVMDCFIEGMTVNVEIKDLPNLREVETVLEILDNYPKLNILISSFKHEYVKKAMSLDLDKIYQYGYLYESNEFNETSLEQMSVKPEYMNLSAVGLTKALIDYCHDKGFKVGVYTVNKKEDLIQMNKMSVDAVFCNYPKVAKELEI